MEVPFGGIDSSEESEEALPGRDDHRMMVRGRLVVSHGLMKMQDEVHWDSLGSHGARLSSLKPNFLSMSWFFAAVRCVRPRTMVRGSALRRSHWSL